MLKDDEKEQKRLKKLDDIQEKRDLLQLGIILDAFNNLEYQIDELIALFYGRYEMGDVFISNIISYLRFSDKLKVLVTILDLEDVKKFKQLSKKEIKFITDFCSIRNVIAHGSYIPGEGEDPQQIFTINSKHIRTFNLSDKMRIRKIKTESSRVGAILCEINFHFCGQFRKTKKLPLIKQPNNEKWLNI